MYTVMPSKDAIAEISRIVVFSFEVNMKITFWLILVVTSPNGNHSTLMHVGNFSTLERCTQAAHLNPFTIGVTLQPRSLHCIQANDADTSPPDMGRQGFLR